MGKRILDFSLLPFRHPERSRGIFLAVAVYDMHAAAQKTARTLISHSLFHRCAKKISRFVRNYDTGECGVLISRLLETLSPLSIIPRAPYPLRPPAASNLEPRPIACYNTYLRTYANT